MFGISPTKILVLIVVVAAVFYGPRLLRRVERMLNRDHGDDADDAALDSRKCPKCGDYVIPSTASDCGQEFCPYA